MAYTLRKINATLKKLNENWNDKYWLFAADGDLHLMRLNNDGGRILEANLGMSQKAIIHSYNRIKSDGGDW